MNIFDVLREDHQRLKQWLSELETEIAATDVGGLEASETPTFDIFSKFLMAHSKAEEKVLYDRLKKAGPAIEAALEGGIEHNLVSTLITQLSRLQRGSRDWNAHFKVLKEMLEHHIKEEESNLFDKAKEVLGEQEIEVLGDRMQQLRGDIPDIQKRIRGASLSREMRH